MLLASLKVTAIILCLTLAANGDESKISDPLKHCLDEKCSVPISVAYTVMGYSGNQQNKLSFKPKEKVTVFGKPPPQFVDDLWYVELNGKKGFIAKTFLKETKIFKTKQSYNEVDSNKDSVLHTSDDQITGKASEGDKLDTQEITNESKDATLKIVSDYNKTITPQETTIETVETKDQNDIVNITTNEKPEENIDVSVSNESPDESDSEDGSIVVEEDDLSLIEQNIPSRGVQSSATVNEGSSERGQIDNSERKNFNFETTETDHLSKNENQNVANIPKLNIPNVSPLTEKQTEDNLSDPNINHNKSDVSSNSEYGNFGTASEDKPSVENLVNSNEDSSPNSKQQEFKESINEIASNKPDLKIQPNKIETVIAGTTIAYGYALTETIHENTPDISNNQPSSEKIPTETSSNIPATREDENFNQIKEQTLLQNDEKTNQLNSYNEKSKTELDSMTTDSHMKDSNGNHNFDQGASHQTNINNTYSDLETENIEIKPAAAVTQNPEPIKQNMYNPFPSLLSNVKANEKVVNNGLNSNPEEAQAKQDTFPSSSDSNTRPKVVDEFNFHTHGIQDIISGGNILDKTDTSSASAHSHIHAKVESNNFESNTLQDNLEILGETSSSHKQESSISHSEHAESVESIEQVSFIDTFLTILPLRNLTSFLLSASFFSDDSYRMMGIDFIENQPLFGMSARMVLFLFIVSVTILTFTLGYYFLDIKRQDGKLVGMVNSLQKDLLCYTKECDMLKDELIVTKEKLAGIEDSSFGTDEMVISLRQDIQKRDVKIEDLENELEKTVKELQSTTRAAEQLQSFIDEVMQWKDQTKLEEEMASIEQLQEENDKLISELESFRSTEEKSTDDLSAIKKLYDDATNLLKVQQHEIESLKEALTGLHGNNITNESLSNIIDHSEIRAHLKNAIQEKDLLTLRVNEDNNTMKVLETELRTTIESLRKSEQDSTRLQVLCDHFKKREAELVKELNTKETLWLSTQGETMTTIEKMQALQSEVQQYKDMCGELRGELANAEASRRSEAADAEKKAHAAWLEARRAQREAEGHKAEAAALRRRLGAPLAPAPPVVSPPLAPHAPHPMLPMPLPPPLLPPPGLPRPPPLGRHPSPPYSPSSTVLANSPPPRYSDYISDRDYPERRGRSPYSPTRMSYQRRRSYSNERYYDDRRHNQMTETETDYSPPPSPRHRRSMHSPRHGPSSGSGQSSDSDK